VIRSRHAAVGSIPAAVHADDEIREWIKALVIPEREVWLAESGEGRVLAMLMLDGGWIDQLYVDPTWTGRGWAPASSSWQSHVDRPDCNCGRSSLTPGRGGSTSATASLPPR
jgi:hypothetical protein